MGPKKGRGWNDGTDHLYRHAKFGGNQMTVTRCERMKSDVFHFIFNFFCNEIMPYSLKKYFVNFIGNDL